MDHLSRMSLTPQQDQRVNVPYPNLPNSGNAIFPTRKDYRGSEQFSNFP
jgi:hypothetical protein